MLAISPIKSFLCNYDALFVALVINMNVLRFFMGIYETNLALYLIYFLAIIILFSKYIKKIFAILRKEYKIRQIYTGFFFLILYAILSLTWSSNPDGCIVSAMKLLISIVIASLSLCLGIHKIKWVLYYSVLINLIYGAVILAFPARMIRYMNGDVNYLNATLTLGLSATISLSWVLVSFFKKALSLMTAVYAGMVVFFYYILVSFAARGVLLFPPLVILIFIGVNFSKNKLKAIVLLVLSIMIVHFAIDFYINNASQYAVSRMTSLFEETENEDRLSIWTNAIECILDNLWFISGGGVDAFRSYQMIYPHNILIQFLGEYGLWGLFVILNPILFILKKFKQINGYDLTSDSWTSVYGVHAAFIYYFLTFNKSFSLYEGCALYVFMFLCISVIFQLYNNKEIVW